MPGTSAIEWTESTWNPVTGCSKVSPGCAHCYAETFAERWRGVPGHPYEQGFDLRLWPARVEQPLRWRRPRMIFVNSMSDLFHEEIPFGESGPRFRPVKPNWLRDLRDRCQAEDVAYFFKQWGGVRPKTGGRTLDGRTWDEIPASAVALMP